MYNNSKLKRLYIFRMLLKRCTKWEQVEICSFFSLGMMIETMKCIFVTCNATYNTGPLKEALVLSNPPSILTIFFSSTIHNWDIKTKKKKILKYVYEKCRFFYRQRPFAISGLKTQLWRLVAPKPIKIKGRGLNHAKDHSFLFY